mgnify:CR=1 FL=1
MCIIRYQLSCYCYSCKELEQIRAIEDFNSDTVIVEQGDTKKSVVVTEAVTPVNAMEQLYMTVTVQ